MKCVSLLATFDSETRHDIVEYDQRKVVVPDSGVTLNGVHVQNHLQLVRNLLDDDHLGNRYVIYVSSKHSVVVQLDVTPR